VISRAHEFVKPDRLSGVADERPDAEEILNRTLRVVDREVKRYEESKAKLSTWDAQALTGYGRFLLAACKAQVDAEDEDLGEASTEELEAEAAAIEARRAQKPKREKRA
jgi:hypothetical protein